MKIKGSILVIGFQKEDKRMLPHLYDSLSYLRESYADVKYIGHGEQGEVLGGVVHDIKTILDLPRLAVTFFSRFFKRNSQGSKSISFAAGYASSRLPTLLRSIVSCYLRRWTLIKAVRNIRFRYARYLVLAIDYTSYCLAEKYFPGRTVFWSYDILPKYAGIVKPKALIIQDEDRQRLLEASSGTTFENVIYLPTGLNDSPFCRGAARTRQQRELSTVNIIQSGWITVHRHSVSLIEDYQKWPDCFALTLHGFIQPDAKSKLSEVKKKPSVVKTIYSNAYLRIFLDRYDVGFVGYGEIDENHRYIENASSQLVEFLRLGIPVVVCGSVEFNNFINQQGVGIGIPSMYNVDKAIQVIKSNYSLYSNSARKLYEARYNLCSGNLIKSLNSLF